MDPFSVADSRNMWGSGGDFLYYSLPEYSFLLQRQAFCAKVASEMLMLIPDSELFSLDLGLSSGGTWW